MALIDGDATCAERAGERRAVGAGRPRHVPSVDGPAGVRQGAQPGARLRHQLRPAAQRGFTAPAGRIMWGLCHHYGVELRNLTPNAISQVACFVAVYEGYLGIPAN
jgi:hypothetical protein